MFGVPRIGRIGSRLTATVFFAGIVFSGVASHAGPGESAYFLPSSSWLVGPAGSPVSQAGSKARTCVMANQYDNGYVVRIAGGAGSIMAMSVDFRQNAFVKGESYEVVVLFPGGFTMAQKALAHDPGTLVLDLRPYREIYNVLKKENEVKLRLGTAEIRLSLAGLPEGLARLEQCYLPAMKETPKDSNLKTASYDETIKSIEQEALPVIDVPGVPLQEPIALLEKDIEKMGGKVMPPPAASPHIPKAESLLQAGTVSPPVEKIEPIRVSADINWNGEHVAIAHRGPEPTVDLPQGMGKTSADKPVPPTWGAASEKTTEEKIREILVKQTFTASAGATSSDQKPKMIIADRPVIWNAKAGEDIRTVLSQWAAIAGYDFVWDSGKSGVVQHDFTFEGTFEEAVANLIGQSGKSIGIAAQVKGKDPMELTKAAELPIPHNYQQGKWHAIRGTDMRNIVQLWAHEAGVELVWESDVNFPVKETVNVKGNFESALQSILEQYSGDQVRPVGTLHKDPLSPRTFLVIKTHRPS